MQKAAASPIRVVKSIEALCFGIWGRELAFKAVGKIVKNADIIS